MIIRSEGLSRKPEELDQTSLSSGVKYASCTSLTLIGVILFVSRSYTRRTSGCDVFVRVNQSSFGRLGAIVSTCCGTPTMSGGRGFHVPASKRAMYMSCSWPTKSVFASGDHVIPCGCFPTIRRTTSFMEKGSMIDVLLPIRLLTATHFPSGDTPS